MLPTPESENTVAGDNRMSKIADARINSFGTTSPKVDFVPQPEEAVFILTSGQIQDLIKEALHPLQDEISDLRGMITAQDLKIASLESIQEQEITRICLDIAYDRRRISKLETPPDQEPKEYSSKVASHLDEIVKALLDRENQSKLTGQKWDFMAFWEVVQLLDLSHRRVSQLADIARNDPRFALGWHPRKKNMKVFRLNHFTLGDIAYQLHKELKEGK